MSPCELLKFLRENQKLSRKKIAELANLSQRTIESYEYGVNKPTDNYKNFIASQFGISPDIFNIEDITEADIEANKLTKFSQCLRQYMLWTGISEVDLGVKYLYDDEIFNWLINAKENQSSVTIKEGACQFIPERFCDIPLYNGSVEIIEENGERKEVDIFMIDLTDRNYFIYFYLVASKVVLAIKHFKPSTFGVSPGDFADVFFGEIPRAKTIIHDHEAGQLYVDLDELEENGIEFNLDNVKRSMTKGVLLNDEQKELLELWSLAPDSLQKGIMDALMENKKQRERYIEITQNIMRLSGLTKKEE